MFPNVLPHPHPWAPRLALGSAVALAIAAAALLLGWPAAPQHAVARSGGIPGYSGNPATNDGWDCSQCHLLGDEPTVVLEGPDRLAPGETGSYLLTITGGQGVAGGLGVSVTGGALGVPAGNVDVRLAAGEIVHVAPKPTDLMGAIVFEYLYTAPAELGDVTMYAAGNSVNGDASPMGDQPSTDVLAITVSDVPATASPTASATLAATATATATRTVTPTASAQTPTQTATATQEPDEARIYLPYADNEWFLDVPTRVPPSVTPVPPSPTVTRTPVPPTETVTPTPSLTPTRTPVPPPSATTPPTATPTSRPATLRIGFLKCDSADEYVRVDNIGGVQADMRGWEIFSTEGSQTFYFPDYTLLPGDSVYVHSGPDAPETGGHRIRWTGSYMWNNGGDTAELLDPGGQVRDEEDC